MAGTTGGGGEGEAVAVDAAQAAPSSPSTSTSTSTAALGKRKREKSEGKGATAARATRRAKHEQQGDAQSQSPHHQQQHNDGDGVADGGGGGDAAMRSVKMEGDADEELLLQQQQAEGAGRANASRWTDEMEQSLMPTPEDCANIRSVLRMLDKQGLAEEALPSQARVANLLEALAPENPLLSLSTLQSHLDMALAAARERHLPPRPGKGKPVAPSAASKALAELDDLGRTMQRLLEECKDSAATRLQHNNVTRAGRQPAHKYALHRNLGNIDLFTSAVELLPSSDQALHGLKDTDVVLVHSSQPPAAQPWPSSFVNPAPKLLDTNPRPAFSRHTKNNNFTPSAEPVTFLYYDHYLSFAPTYDSSSASLSYRQSVSQRAARQSLQTWGQRTLPPLPPVESPSAVRSAINPTLLQQEQGEASINDLTLYLRNVEDSQIVDQRLQENAELLRSLQEAQFERLRRSAAGRDRTDAAALVSELEAETADRVSRSLTTILNARPRTAQSPVASEALPVQQVYRQIKREVVQPDAGAYYGLLDPRNGKGVRDYLMTTAASFLPKAALNGAGSSNMDGVDRKPLSIASQQIRRTSSSGGKKDKKTKIALGESGAAPSTPVSGGTSRKGTPA